MANIENAELYARFVTNPNYNTYGTCFALSKNIFLTAGHVPSPDGVLVSDICEPKDRFSKSMKMLPAKVAWKSSSLDLAALEITSPFTESEFIAPLGQGVSLGETISTFGYPYPTLEQNSNKLETVHSRVFNGNVARVAYAKTEWFEDKIAPIFETSFPILEGQSGSPVLNRRNQVVGICIGSSEQYRFVRQNIRKEKEEDSIFEIHHGWTFGICINIPEAIKYDEGFRVFIKQVLQFPSGS